MPRVNLTRSTSRTRSSTTDIGSLPSRTYRRTGSMNFSGELKSVRTLPPSARYMLQASSTEAATWCLRKRFSTAPLSETT